MISALLKKDYLLIKKYVWIMLCAAIAIPPVMRLRMPEFTGQFGFILSAIFSVLILLQYVSLKEYQFPKATALLCTTPFTRVQMVFSRYLFCLMIYAVCCITYKIETLIFPWLGTADIRLFVGMFFATATFLSIYLPIQYKLGYEKTKFAFFLIALASPILLPVLLRIANQHANLLSHLASAPVYIRIFLISLAILALSLFTSVQIFQKTDLQ